MKFSVWANSNEDGKREPGEEGLSIIEGRLWELPEILRLELEQYLSPLLFLPPH